MKEEKKAALRRRIEELEDQVTILKHYINIWPGADTTQERASVEKAAIARQNSKVSGLMVDITRDIARMLCDGQT